MLPRLILCCVLTSLPCGRASAQMAGMTTAPPPEPTMSAAYAALIERAVTNTVDKFESVYDEAVALRMAEGHLTEPEAHLAVNRDLAQRALAPDMGPRFASLYLRHALEIARKLERADELIAIHTDLAASHYQSRNILTAIEHAKVAWAMTNQLERPVDERSKIGLLLADILQSAGESDETEAIFANLLASPGVDRISVELKRAQVSDGYLNPSIQVDRWEAVAQHATVARNHVVAAMAHDRLGLIKFGQGKHEAAYAHFKLAASLQPAHVRDASAICQQVDLEESQHGIPAAMELLEAALSGRPSGDPGRAVPILEKLADLQAKTGDHASAFATLKRANQYLHDPDFAPRLIKMIRTTYFNPGAEVDAAAELAAVRNSLRETELTRTQLQRQRAYGIGFTTLVIAVALAIAYAYKRRSATALAVERDNAELRADRTHWQMLRYQLNPHFLFNALSSLDGLIRPRPEAAQRVVERLSEFCQLALDGSNDELRSLEHELKLLRAYLDVEQAGAGDNLVVQFDIDPAALPIPIPPLLLQPLVENALKYGGLTSVDTLHIRIRAHATDNELTVEVANSGTWVSPSPRPPRRRASIGLNNVRERLRRLIKSADPLTIAADSNEVRVSFRLPLISAQPPPLS